MKDADDGLGEALRACARGERDALRRIYDAEAGRMITIAQRILRRRDLAEEVVHEAFIQIWRKAAQYAPDRGSARGWIYAVVRNRSLNVLRDSSREDHHDHDTLERMQEDGQTAFAADILGELDESSRLKACLQTLDETTRKSIVMAYMSGYSHGEIAGRLSVPLGTAKAWIRRGLAALRECMA